MRGRVQRGAEGDGDVTGAQAFPGAGLSHSPRTEGARNSEHSLLCEFLFCHKGKRTC